MALGDVDSQCEGGYITHRFAVKRTFQCVYNIIYLRYRVTDLVIIPPVRVRLSASTFYPLLPLPHCASSLSLPQPYSQGARFRSLFLSPRWYTTLASDGLAENLPTGCRTGRVPRRPLACSTYEYTLLVFSSSVRPSVVLPSLLWVPSFLTRRLSSLE